MVDAYVLINVKPGHAYDVLHALEKIKEIKRYDAVTGPYDIIALVSCLDFHILGELILEKIQGLEGVEKTLTCPVFRLEET